MASTKEMSGLTAALVDPAAGGHSSSTLACLSPPVGNAGVRTRGLLLDGEVSGAVPGKNLAVTQWKLQSSLRIWERIWERIILMKANTMRLTSWNRALIQAILLRMSSQEQALLCKC